MLIKKQAYQFETAQVATRFLNALKAGVIDGVRASLHIGSDSVLASYQIDPTAHFDETCSQLDQLAEQHNGYEVDC